ncbi:MAG: hypothetical protein ACOC44_11870 [Promethearchaeia archaeon]
MTDSIPYVVSWLLVTLLFGTLLYVSSLIFNLRDKSYEYDSYFWLRSYLVSIITTFIVVFFEFVFFLLSISPLFGERIPVELVNAVMTTSLQGIVANIAIGGIGIIVMFVIFIILIVAVVSVIMLEIYKVSYLWTTLTTWTTIGIYLGLDFLINTFLVDGGFAGLIGIVGDLIRGIL